MYESFRQTFFEESVLSTTNIYRFWTFSQQSFGSNSYNLCSRYARRYLLPIVCRIRDAFGIPCTCLGVIASLRFFQTCLYYFLYQNLTFMRVICRSTGKTADQQCKMPWSNFLPELTENDEEVLANLSNTFDNWKHQSLLFSLPVILLIFLFFADIEMLGCMNMIEEVQKRIHDNS